MKVVIDGTRVNIYVEGEVNSPSFDIEIETDRLRNAARNSYLNRAGAATWADGAIRIFIQDEGADRG